MLKNDFLQSSDFKTDLTIIGSGYVGLVSALGFTTLKKKVCCTDIDVNKIEKLKNKILPIYEPGLVEILEDAINYNYINFTSDIDLAIQNSQIIFIAVNTPSQDDGSADISAVKDVAKNIAKNLNSNKIICLKSTVPIGTYKIVESIINSEKKTSFNFEIVSVPEFLREGSALYDFLNPDRIIIGAKSKDTFEQIKSLFDGIKVKEENIIWTSNLSAETIKYTANSFLALKISFINEISNFCDALNIDTLEVARGIGLDERIGSQFLNPGPGFGGSCFPKDIQAIIKMADDAGINLKLIKETLLTNEKQKENVVNRLSKLLDNNLKNKVIAVLGLSFKANTDDIRKSPAIDIIKSLKSLGAHINAYDPKAMNNMKNEISDITYCDIIHDTVKNANAILILTEWDEFKNLEFDLIKDVVKQKIIFDTRNIVNYHSAIQNGFIYDSIGREYLKRKGDA